MLAIALVIAGLACGYVVVSVCESLFHRLFGHCQAEHRIICRRGGWLGALVLRAWYDHTVIHHFGTFQTNHVTQFSSEKEEAHLRRRLVASGRSYALRDDYGLRVGGPDQVLIFMGPTVPFVAILCWVGGPWFSLGMVMPLIAMPMMSEFVHPLLHLPNEQARSAAPAVLKPFVRSRYFQHLARHHWLHHRHPTVNFNLLLGGDHLLGCHRRPSTEERAEMAAIGL